jgi:type I restriction enzyme S subunit
MSEWDHVAIGSALKLTSGFPFPSSRFSEEEGVPLIRIRDIVRSSIETRYLGPYSPSYVVRRGDVLIGMDGDFNVVRWRNEDALLNQRVLKIEVADESMVDLGFAFYWLAPYIEKVNAATAATTVKHLSIKDVKKAIGRIPGVPAQRKIAAVLSSLDAAIERAEALIEKHQQIKAGLMHDLFTRGVLPSGELRPSLTRAQDLYWRTQIGVVPCDWQPMPLASLVSSDITYGIVQAGPHIDDETGIPYVRTGDMSGDFLDRSQMLCTSPAIAAAYKRSEIREGDIVMAIRASVGKVLRVPAELNGANLTQGTAKIAPKDDVDGSFLLWAMRQDRFQEQVLSAIKGTTFAEITLAALRQLPLAMPTSRDEQSMIASRLDLHQEVIRAEQRQLAKLRFQKLGLMQDLLTGKVRVPLTESVPA